MHRLFFLLISPQKSALIVVTAPKTGRCQQASIINIPRLHVAVEQGQRRPGAAGAIATCSFAAGAAAVPALQHPASPHPLHCTGSPRFSHSLPPLSRARAARDLRAYHFPPCSHSALHLRPPLPTHSLPRKTPQGWQRSFAVVRPIPLWLPPAGLGQAGADAARLSGELSVLHLRPRAGRGSAE